MSYKPNPGSIASRAIAHLETLAGAEISGPRLAEAIGCEPTSIAASLAAARAAGVVFSRQKGGHIRSPVFWSTEDHSRPPDGLGWLAPDTPKGGDLRQVLKAEAERPDATDREIAADDVSPGGGPMGAGQTAAAAPLQGRRVCISSDGEVAVEATDGTVILFQGEAAAYVIEFMRAYA